MPVTMRHTSRGYPDPVWTPTMPRIPDHVLDCCVFLYPSRAAAENGEPAGGSGFLVGISLAGDNANTPPYFYYAVTNKHVAKSAPNIRINTLDGKTDVIDRESAEWFWPKTTDDFAVTPISIQNGYRYSGEPIGRLVDDEVIADHAFGAGDEVLSVGRFVDTSGAEQNRPVVRFGNVARMPELPVWDDEGAHDSYLVEMRSRTGYSGSPIFIYAAQNMFEWVKRPETKTPQDRLLPWVLGIQWGQFPIIHTDMKMGEGKASDIIGSGMTAVVPAGRIKKFLLEHPGMASQREASRRAHKNRTHVDRSAAVETPQPSDESPQHKEAFTSLLNAAAQKKPQAD